MPRRPLTCSLARGNEAFLMQLQYLQLEFGSRSWISMFRSGLPGFCWGQWYVTPFFGVHPLEEFNIAPENRPKPKRKVVCLPSIIVQGRGWDMFQFLLRSDELSTKSLVIFLYLGDEILPIFIEIRISHYKQPYESISTVIQVLSVARMFSYNVLCWKWGFGVVLFAIGILVCLSVNNCSVLSKLPSIYESVSEYKFE